MGVGTGTGVRSPPHDRAVRSVNAVSTRQTQERGKWGNRAVGVFRLITLTPTLSLRERGACRLVFVLVCTLLPTLVSPEGEGAVGGGLESKCDCPEGRTMLTALASRGWN